jgi:hypothetical protein
MQDHSASDKSVWYALLMLGRLPTYPLKAPFRTVSEGEFSEVRLNGVLKKVSVGAWVREERRRHSFCA